MCRFVRSASDRWLNLQGVTQIQNEGGMVTVYYGDHEVKLGEVESGNFVAWLMDNDIVAYPDDETT